MVHDAFSVTLFKAVGSWQLSGVKVRRHSPPISHIFFADDSLLFLKVDRAEISVVKDLLRDYCEASGQRINFLKLRFYSRRIC